MEILEQTIDRLATPPVLYSAVLLLVAFASRSRFLLTRWGGAALALLVTATLAIGLADPNFRGLVTESARMPAMVWFLLTLVCFWVALHRADEKQTADIATEPDRGTADGPIVVTAGLVVLALAYFLEPPLGESALRTSQAGASTQALGTGPWFLSGFREMRFYFDPWMATVGLPALYVIALLALPYLDIETAAEDDTEGERGRQLTFAAAALLLVVLPVIVATFLRGPHWNVFGPFTVRDAAHPAPIPAVPLSDVFWCRWLGMTAPPSGWAVRELPGTALLVGWFVLVPWWLTRWGATRKTIDRYRQAVGPWRYRLALILGMALALVPLKMFSRWLFDIGHWLSVPELAISF